MPRFGPIKRRDLIHNLRELGFEGPYAGGKYQYMVKGEIKLAIPNPHQSDIIEVLASPPVSEVLSAQLQFTTVAPALPQLLAA